MISATKTCFQKYFTLSGRAGRAEFWWFMLFQVLIGVVAVSLDVLVFGLATLDSDFGGVFGNLISLAVLIPTITVTVRRLHDTGKPGYYIFVPVLLFVVPIALAALVAIPGIQWLVGGAIIAGGILFFWWMVQPSDPGPNAYGSGQGQAALAEVFE